MRKKRTNDPEKAESFSLHPKKIHPIHNPPSSKKTKHKKSVYFFLVVFFLGAAFFLGADFFLGAAFFLATVFFLGAAFFCKGEQDGFETLVYLFNILCVAAHSLNMQGMGSIFFLRI